ncbi:TPA: Arm DNA-binding domain-containing protein, partial [Enterococcus faecium]
MYKDQNTKTWFFRAYLGFDENGKKIQKTRRGFKTQKEAKIAYDRFMVTHAFNRPLTEMISNNNKMTFEEFYKTRFVKWYEKQVKSQTYENAQYIFEKKLKYFYHIPLKDITMQDIEDWMFELSKTITKNARVVDSNRTLSNSYINRIIDNYICNTIKFCNLWHILNFRFEDIEIRIRNKIFEKIKEISFWNSSTEIEIISIINKMTENMDDVEKIQKYRAYLKKFMNTQHINHRIKDRFFNCAFLLEIISKEKSPFFDKRQTLTFDYTQETFKILINIIKEQSETWKFYNFSFLLEHTSVGLLTKIIEDQSLKINGETRYPDDFLKITIIQRIIINIDLDEKDIPECLIKKTNELIDWDYNLYGKEMNDYVKKHNIDIEQKFIDGIGPVTGGWVKTHPFIPVSPLTNLSQVDVLVDLLNKCPDWETQVSNDNFLNERSKQGQNEEIIRVLN